jgi:YaiO family outer membrane protein
MRNRFRHPINRSLVLLACSALASPLACARGQEASVSPPDQSEAQAQPSFSQGLAHAHQLAVDGAREEAIAAYSALLVQHPGNSDVLLGRGRVHAWKEQWAAAESDLLAATTASPDYADAWSALGDMYLWSDQPAKAAEAYTHWVALRPDDPAPRIARGRALRATGAKDAARVDFEAARAMGGDPTKVDGYLRSLMTAPANPEAFVPKGYTWSGSLSASRSWFGQGRRSPWSEYTATVRRHFEHGSVALELLNAHRFGNSDHALAVDAYVDVWHRAYANLRYQGAPGGGLYPDYAWRAEVFQGVGHGWELSGSYDRLGFSSPVDIYGAGVAKYTGNFYLRGRVLYVPGDGGHSLGFRGQVRYYYAGDGDNYLEFNAGYGRSSDLPGNNGLVTRKPSTSASVAFVKYPSPRWGFKVGLDYGDDADGITERGVFGSLYRRW